MSLKLYACNGCHFEMYVKADSDLREAECPFARTITHKSKAVGLSPVNGREVQGIVEIV